MLKKKWLTSKCILNTIDMIPIQFNIYYHILISTDKSQAHGAWISFPPPPFSLLSPPLFQNFHINHSFFKIFIIIRFSSFYNISRRHTSWIIRVFCVHSFSTDTVEKRGEEETKSMLHTPVWQINDKTKRDKNSTTPKKIEKYGLLFLVLLTV